MLSSLTEEETTPGLVWSDCIYAGVPVSYGADSRNKLLTVTEIGGDGFNFRRPPRGRLRSTPDQVNE
jgi:hypothetical protein